MRPSAGPSPRPGPWLHKPRSTLLPHAAPTPSQQSRAEGAAFFGDEDFDGLAVDAGLDFAPEGAARSAAAEADGGDGNAEVGEEREGVLEGIGDAFLDGADEVRPGVLDADAGKGRADFGVEVGGALAQQVRRPLEAFAAGRDFCRVVVERVVVWPAKNVSRSQCRLRPALWVTPMTCQSPGTAWQKVWRRPLGSRWVWRWRQRPRPRCRWWPRPSRAENAHADRARALVACAGRDRRAGFEAGEPGRPSLMRAQISGDSKTAGSQLLGMPAASATSLDQRRWVTSSSSVPEASCTSMANSPVRR